MKVSVVITTYNRPDFLKEALVGLKNQTIKPFEVIVIDDNSSKDYQEVFPLIESLNARYLKQSVSCGANKARNIGISESSGDVVAFLDDDDVWLPNYLEVISAEFTLGCEAVVTGFRQLGKEHVVVVNADNWVTKQSLLRGNTYCGMSGFSCKRELLEELKFDETLNNGQDWDMYVRLFEKGVQFRNINTPMFLYRFQNEDGIGAKARKMKPDEIEIRLGSARKHKEFLGDFWFRKRVCEQVLFSLGYKKRKLSWVLKAIELAGFKAVLYFVYNAFRRKLLKKPLAI